MQLRSIFILIRPKQWIKNLFILAPLLFSREAVDLNGIVNIFITFTMFCVAASIVYVYNDIKDIEKDREHPVKSRKRPLASGAVKITEAYLVILCLFSILIGLFFVIKNMAVYIVILYLILNYFYTIKFKHLPIIDVFSIAIGFVLRVIAGNFSLNTNISEWMIISTFCLSLYLATIKRRQEVSNSGVGARSVLGKYSIGFIDRMAEFSAISALIFYSMFSILERPIFVYTIPIVMFGLLRYWYIVELYDDGESPTDVLYNDLQIQIVLILWVFLIFVLGRVL